MQYEKLLARVRALQVELALEETRHPKEKSAFGFGVVCGEQRGLQRIEQLIQEEIEDEKRDEDE